MSYSVEYCDEYDYSCGDYSEPKRGSVTYIKFVKCKFCAHDLLNWYKENGRWILKFNNIPHKCYNFPSARAKRDAYYFDKKDRKR